MNKYILTKDLRLKSGDVFEIGEECAIRWDRSNPCIALVAPESLWGTRELRIRSSYLPRFFKEIYAPTNEDLEEWTFDSICGTALGDEVEPDGWGEEGDPSWLLAFGMI